MNENYYDILGITEEEKNLQGDAFRDVCSKKFKKLSLKYHPDRHVNDSEEDKKKAEDMFKKINEANTVLSDPNKRRNYDMFGTADGQQGGGFDGFEFNDFFKREQRIVKGENVEVVVEIDIEIASNGGDVNVKYKQGVKCSHCDGTGSADKSVDKCPYCNGTGRIRQQTNTPFGVQIFETGCSHCGGTGRKINHKCEHCNGTGIESIDRNIKINVPKGVQENAGYPIQGEGNAPMYGEGVNGDLIIFFKITEKNGYSKEDINIIYNLELNLEEAWIGCTKEVKNLDGKKYTINIEPLTPSGKEYVFKNGGFNGSVRQGFFNVVEIKGNFIVRVRYKIPTSINSEQKALLKEFYNLENKK